MERSGSQKFLLVISIINIAFGIIGILGAIFLIMAGGLSGSVDAAELAESGITQQDIGMVGGIFSMLGLTAMFSSALGIIQGILGIRAANDNQKIMPVWVLALIGLVFGVIALVMTVVNGTFGTQGLSSIISLVISGLMFWVANNIKQQAGK